MLFIWKSNRLSRLTACRLRQRHVNVASVGLVPTGAKTDSYPRRSECPPFLPRPPQSGGRGKKGKGERAYSVVAASLRSRRGRPDGGESSRPCGAVQVLSNNEQFKFIPGLACRRGEYFEICDRDTPRANMLKPLHNRPTFAFLHELPYVHGASRLVRTLPRNTSCPSGDRS